MPPNTRRTAPVATEAASTSSTADSSSVGDAHDLVDAAIRAEALAQMRETIRQIRAAQDAQDAERELQPLTGCPDGCSSRDGKHDPDCARWVRDFGARYRARVDRQRTVECRALRDLGPDSPIRGAGLELVNALIDGAPVEAVAHIYGLSVEDVQMVLDALPARLLTARQVDE